jgi:hypothetical protein
MASVINQPDKVRTSLTITHIKRSLAVVSVALLCGCAQSGGTGFQVGQIVGGSTKQMAVNSPVGDFLPDPGLLIPGNPGQPSLIYLNPAMQPGSYTSVLIDPVVVSTASSETLQDLGPAQRQALAAAFAGDLATAVQKVCPLATSPGPNTMHLRVALVDAFQPNAVINTAASYTPYASTAYGAASVLFNHGVGYFAGTATAEAYATGDGALIFQAVDKRGGSTSLVSNTLNTWLDVHHAFQAWSNVMATRMKAMGFCPQPT